MITMSNITPNVPIPPKRGGVNGARIIALLERLDAMKPGDSCVVNDDNRSAHAISSWVCTVAKRYGHKITTRKSTTGGVRVWKQQP